MARWTSPSSYGNYDWLSNPYKAGGGGNLAGSRPATSRAKPMNQNNWLGDWMGDWDTLDDEIKNVYRKHDEFSGLDESQIKEKFNAMDKP